MNRRIIRLGICGVLLTSVAVGATVSTKSRSTSKKGAATTSVSIRWIEDLQKAHRVANTTGKPLLIVVGGPSCQHCKRLEHEVLQHPTIARYINQSYVPVHLDSSKDREAVEILEIESLPTTLALSPDAELLGKIEGYVGTKEFATMLKQASDVNKSMRGDQVAMRSKK